MSAAETISRNCPVCAGVGTLPYLMKGELQLVRCLTCDMIFANPVPAEYATGQYYDQTAAGYYLSAPKLQSDYSPVRFERELSLFRAHCPRGEVLDVGCGSGAFLYHLRNRFGTDYRISGTDVSGPPLNHAEAQGIPVIRGNFPEHDFGNQKFDAITFWAVLEHLFEPVRFIKKAAEILKPAGICFVLVPNINSLAVRLLGKRYRYIYTQHLNYFSAETLIKMVSGYFSVRQLKTTHFNPIVIWQDSRRGGAEISNEERGALLKRTTGYKQKGILAPVRLGYKGTEWLLGATGLADNLVIVLEKRA
jgi:2-polyprenyl-3-methyl-5-hydroxy-6-metoxy-1,4-benzoquinol methylase